MTLLSTAAALAATHVLPLDPSSRACADHDPLDQCQLCKKFHPAADIPQPRQRVDSRMADRYARDCTDRSAPGPNSNADYMGGASDYCPTEQRQ